METVFFMYDQVSAVRSNGPETEIIHKKARRHSPAERHVAAQSYEDIRGVFMRDCTVVSIDYYMARRLPVNDRPIFIEFQSMDHVNQGEPVILNPSDIMSYGGSSNEGGVYVTTFSGLMFVIPAELKSFVFAHEWHKKNGTLTSGATIPNPTKKAA